MEVEDDPTRTTPTQDELLGRLEKLARKTAPVEVPKAAARGAQLGLVARRADALAQLAAWTATDPNP